MAEQIKTKDIIDVEGVSTDLAKISKLFKDFSDSILASNNSLTATTKVLGDVAAITKEGNKAIESYKKSTEKAKDTNKELTVEMAKQKEVSRENTANIKAQAAAQLYASDSIKGMQAQIRLLNVEYQKMDKNTRENTARGKELTASLKGLRDKLNEVKLAAGDSSSNIGKYSEGIKKGFSGIGGIISSATGSVGAFGRALVAALANPIGLILAAVAAIVAFVSKLSVVKNVLAAIGSALSALGANLDKVFKAWWDWILIIFNALKGVIQLLTGQFSDAMDSFKKVGDNAKDAAEQISGLGKAMKDAYTASTELSKATKRVAIENNALTKSIDEIADGFGGLNIRINDTTRSTEERHKAFLQLEKDTAAVLAMEEKRAKNNEMISKMELDLLAKTSIQGEKSKEYLEKEVEYLGKKKEAMAATSAVADFASAKNQRAVQEAVRLANESITSVERLNTAITKGIEKSANDSRTTLLELGEIGAEVSKRTEETAKNLGSAIKQATQGKIKSSDLFDEKGVLKTDEAIANIIDKARLAPEEIAAITNAITLLNKNNALGVQINNRLLADTKKIKDEIAAADKAILEQTIKRNEVLASKGGGNDLSAIRANNEAALQLQNDYYERVKSELLNSIKESEDNIKLSEEEKKAARLKGNVALENLEVEHQNNLKRIAETEQTWRIQLIKNITDEQTRIYENAELAILNTEISNREELERLYRAGLLTEEDYAKRGVEIQRQAQKEKLSLQLQFLEKAAAVEGLPEEERVKALKGIADIKLAILELDKVELKNLTKEFQNLQNTISTIAGGLVDATASITDIAMSGSEKRIIAIQEEMQALQDKADRDMQLAEGNAFAQMQIQNKLAEDKKQLEKKEREEKAKMAKLDKAKALFDIAINTAVGVMKASPIVPLMVMVGALGALQAAAVAARPLPAYEKGTKFAKGGLSIVGEKGAELVTTPSGDAFLTPAKATLMDIPRGSKVFTAKETSGKIKENQNINITLQPQRAKTSVNIDKEGVKTIVKETYLTRKRYH